MSPDPICPPAQKSDCSNSAFSSWSSCVRPSLRSKKERFTLIFDYWLAIDKGRGEEGFQRKAMIDLRTTPEKEVFLVGDLHGRIDNFSALLESGIEEKLEKGEGILLLLGDVVHNDHPVPSDAPDFSVQLMEKVMSLKVRYPCHVYLLLGNHDFLYAAKQKGVSKQRLMNEQNYLLPKAQQYKEALIGRLDPDVEAQYIHYYSDCIEKGALIAIGEGFVALHAGPVKGESLENIMNVPIVDTFLDRQEPIVLQATWNRFHKEYNEKDVEEFLSTCNLPQGQLIVGHTPNRERPHEWYWPLTEQHTVIYSANDTFGYLSFKGTKGTFVTVK